MGGSDQSGIPRPGDVLGGKYEVRGVLGAGGMGVVLSAWHRDLGQRVAIKFLNAQFAASPQAVARFLREARAAAAVQSEHVARVLDVARTEAGVPYLVMEHLAGADLDHVLRERGPLPVDEAVDFVLQACEALAEAHAAGIVHRDLKPGNLFLARRADGSPLVKVLDFGMSKVTAPEGVAEGSLTSPTDVLGSPWYMSPEQVRSTKNVDARSDVWSLGVILHKLLTGTQAFQAETLSACLVKIVTEPPVPLRTARPDAPAGLEAVILRCLEKDRERRLQSVAELAWALLPFAAERSRLSAERVVRVLGGASAPVEKTILLSAAVPLPEVISTGPSVSPAPPPVRRAALSAPLMVAGVLAVLAAAGFVAARVLGGPHADVTTAATAAPAPPPPDTTTATALPLDPVPSAAPPDPPPSAAPVFTARPVLHATSTRLPPRPPPPSANCNPPYVIDSAGIRTRKPECK